MIAAAASKPQLQGSPPLHTGPARKGRRRGVLVHSVVKTVKLTVAMELDLLCFRNAVNGPNRTVDAITSSDVIRRCVEVALPHLWISLATGEDAAIYAGIENNNEQQ